MSDHTEEINALTEPVNSQCDDELSLTLSLTTKNIILHKEDLKWSDRKMQSRLSAHLLVQPTSHHHWDIEVSLNGLISLAKAVHLPGTSGVLREGEKAENGVRCVFAFVRELAPGQAGWSETKQSRLPGSRSLRRDAAS